MENQTDSTKLITIQYHNIHIQYEIVLRDTREITFQYPIYSYVASE